jgi:hypothetical protein
LSVKKKCVHRQNSAAAAKPSRSAKAALRQTEKTPLRLLFVKGCVSAKIDAKHANGMGEVHGR